MYAGPSLNHLIRPQHQRLRDRKAERVWRSSQHQDPCADLRNDPGNATPLSSEGQANEIAAAHALSKAAGRFQLTPDVAVPDSGHSLRCPVSRKLDDRRGSGTAEPIAASYDCFGQHTGHSLRAGL